MIIQKTGMIGVKSAETAPPSFFIDNCIKNSGIILPVKAVNKINPISWEESSLMVPCENA